MRNHTQPVLLIASLLPNSASQATRAGEAMTWERLPLNGGLVRVIISDPREARRLYAGTGTGLSRSEDASVTWSALGLNDLEVSALVEPPSAAVGGHRAVPTYFAWCTTSGPRRQTA